MDQRLYPRIKRQSGRGGRNFSAIEAQGPLLQNSAGIVSCSFDFVEEGIVQALGAALPFPLVGCTTLASALREQADVMQLSLTVLSADDCSFSSAQSRPLTPAALQESLQEMVGRASAALPERAALALAFFPLREGLSGEPMTQALDEALDGVPVFGTIGCAYDMNDFRSTFTVHGSDCLGEAAAILLISGNIEPVFLTISAAPRGFQTKPVAVSAARGNILEGLGGKPLLGYLESVGWARGQQGLSSVPFVVNYHDGTPPVVRAIYRVFEDGTAYCSGQVPLGSSVALCSSDEEHVIETASELALQLSQIEGAVGALLFSCLGRSMVLGLDMLKEARALQAGIKQGLPWQACYSGGEFCPVDSPSGGLLNRFHNHTLIACVLRTK